jgi:D-glycero-alpha-D-manno-heptose-7-phosphate kinase
LPSFSGLGYSSAFCASVLAAVYDFENRRVNKLEIAETACNVEIDMLCKPIGKQDQYACVVGGVNSIKYEKNDVVRLTSIPFHSKFIVELERSVLLIWTGISRSADVVLTNVIENLSANRNYFMRLNDLANYFDSKIFSDGEISIEEFSSLITESWSLKQQTSSLILPTEIKEIESKIKKYPFWGWKLLGAGGGGFFLALGSEACIRDFMNNETDYFTFQPKFDAEGLKCMLKERPGW